MSVIYEFGVRPWIHLPFTGPPEIAYAIKARRSPKKRAIRRARTGKK